MLFLIDVLMQLYSFQKGNKMTLMMTVMMKMFFDRYN